MPGRWIQERKSDTYYRRAKEEGYRSRAAYKLKQLKNRFHFFKKAERVLDLGAAPGGWLQVASEEVGEDGLVIGVDIEEIEPLGLGNVVTITGDVTDEETEERIGEALGGKADVILSDMAPKVTGVWEMDHYRQIHLSRVALAIADRLLREEGWAVLKVFQGSEFNRFVGQVRDMFRTVKIVKPRASRKESAEVYIVARNLKPDRIIPEELRPPEEEEEA